MFHPWATQEPGKGVKVQAFPGSEPGSRWELFNGGCGAYEQPCSIALHLVHQEHI